MKPARFEYARPDTLAAALDLLAEHGSDAAVLAGGQSLMPMLNLRLAGPALVVDINRIPGLDAITLENGRLTLGSRVRHNDVLRSPLVRGAAPLLVEALGHVAHEAIRNRGTLGGSLALADPAAELPACLACLDAEIRVASARGERTIPAADFVQTLYTTALEPDELIVSVSVEAAGPSWRFGFDEITRRHGDYAIAALALAARLDGDRIAECRAVFAGVEPAPKRAAGAEQALVGAGLQDEAALAAARAALAGDLEPMEEGAYPPAYRLSLAGALIGRVLKRMVARR